MSGKKKGNEIAILIGCLLMLFGVWKLSEHFFGNWWGSLWQVINTVSGILWPVVIIIIGVAIVYAACTGKLVLPADKKLYRSKRNRKIAGVCGGIADYLSADPAIVRIVYLLLIITVPFVVIPLYILLWIILPEESTNTGNWV